MPHAILLMVATLALVAACAGPAPAPGRSSAYAADRDACESSVPDAVNKRNAKTGLSWFASPVRRWSQIDDGVATCLADKGWGRTRACTADELRGGNRTTTLSVGAVGVRCTDPATRS